MAPNNQTNGIFCDNCGDTITNGWVAPNTSRHQQILRTNNVPPYSDAGEIRETLNTATSDIQRLDGEIARVELILEELKRSRVDAQRFADEHRAALSPLRKVPPEILSEIFSACMALRPTPSTIGKRHDSCQVKDFPWIFGQVCGRWRDIALSSPNLWTNVDIYLGSGSHSLSDTTLPIDYFVRLVEMWLQRSGNLPLSIGLVAYCERDAYPFLDVLLPHSRRWQTAFFQIPIPALRVLSSVKHDMHNLQSLRIKNLLGVSGPEPEVSGAFEATSGLKKLSLTGYLGPAHKWLRLPWSQLTRYEGSWELSPDQHLQVLGLATNLVECRISINDERSSIPPSTLVVLEHLQTLELQVTSNTHVLEHLSLPALKSLLIHKPLWAKPKAGFLHPLSAFLSHSSRNLEKMKLVAEPLLDIDLIASLQETSALTELEIITMDLDFMSNGLLHDLTSGAFVIAPKLRKLGIDCRKKNFDDQNLVSMLQSRWAAAGNCAQLEAFLLRGVPLEHETINTLNKLRLDGMSVGYSMEKGLRSLYL